jgi:hypothetical protein
VCCRPCAPPLAREVGRPPSGPPAHGVLMGGPEEAWAGSSRRRAGRRRSRAPAASTPLMVVPSPGFAPPHRRDSPRHGWRRSASPAATGSRGGEGGRGAPPTESEVVAARETVGRPPRAGSPTLRRPRAPPPGVAPSTGLASSTPGAARPERAEADVSRARGFRRWVRVRPHRRAPPLLHRSRTEHTWMVAIRRGRRGRPPRYRAQGSLRCPLHAWLVGEDSGGGSSTSCWTEGNLVLFINTEPASGPQAAADVEKGKLVGVEEL